VQIVFAQFQLSAYSMSIVIAQGKLRCGEKSAVDAAAFAEGDMNVDASHDVLCLIVIWSRRF
jgi:hypothetical protein